MDGPGYHLRKITKGELGEVSKIREEFEEFEDAVEQGCRLMAMVELSDMLGAIEAYLARHHKAYTLGDLISMKEATQRAFRNGHR